MKVHVMEKLSSDRRAHSAALSWHAELYEAGLTDVLALSGGEQAVVACSNDGRVTGVIVWELEEETSTAWVALIYVHEDYRKNGVLTELWKEFYETVLAQGIHGIELGVMEGNAPAIKAYEKLGGTFMARIYRWSVM